MKLCESNLIPLGPDTEDPDGVLHALAFYDVWRLQCRPERAGVIVHHVNATKDIPCDACRALEEAQDALRAQAAAAPAAANAAANGGVSRARRAAARQAAAAKQTADAKKGGLP